MNTLAVDLRRLEHCQLVDEILFLDVKAFDLERRMDRLERKWPGRTPNEQRALRFDRMKMRADLEILKIELSGLKRRFSAYEHFHRELAGK
jgi:hypothetical protein